MKNLLLPIASFIIFHSAHSATVDTISIRSNAMQKDIKCVVIKPSTKKKKGIRFPVVYLLHGYGGWYSNWIIRVPELKEYADQYQLIIVCPDGGNNWYFDSPVNPAVRYETFVAIEIPDYIDSHYPTVAARKSRAITGLSMGGHGGLFIGFRHADRFGACGSMSGAVDINNLKNKYELMKLVGDTVTAANTWKNFSAMNLPEHYPQDSITITIDCGTEDFFYNDNHRLHEKLLKLKIPHDYTERPGKHDWAYWRNSIKYQLLFFHSYFAMYK